jgi:hypothetical protein
VREDDRQLRCASELGAEVERALALGRAALLQRQLGGSFA